MGLKDFCEVILCVLIPPVGLLISGLDKGIQGGELCRDTCLNLLLTLLLFIPGK